MLNREGDHVDGPLSRGGWPAGALALRGKAAQTPAPRPVPRTGPSARAPVRPCVVSWGSLVSTLVERAVENTLLGIRTALRRRWLALGGAAVSALLGAAVVATLDDSYQASARVYVDTQTVLKPLMANLSFQPDTDQQVGMLARTLISRPNIERLLQSPALLADLADEADREALVARLSKQIKIVPAGEGNLYELSYRGRSPERAQRLVAAALAMFMSANSGEKRRDAQDAGRFIEEQIGLHEAKLAEAENRLKDFKVRNFGVSGVSNEDYFARVSALSDSVAKLKLELGAAEQTRDAYRRELAAEEPLLPLEAGPRSGGAAFDTAARLVTQRKLLDELLRRYTEAHPDVSTTRRIIAELEREQHEQLAAERRELAAVGKAAMAATSPVYQKLRVSLAEAEARVAGLRSQVGMHQAQLDEVRSAAGRVPQVEAELAQLNRDYAIIRKNYDLLVSRRESATLGQRVDATLQTAEFRVVDPPLASPTPLFPSRKHLAGAAVLVSPVVGVLLAVLADWWRPAFHDAGALRAFSRRPVLGVVTTLITPQARQIGRAHV